MRHKIISNQIIQVNQLISKIKFSIRSNIYTFGRYCSRCEIYCNSKSQFEVHMVSTKHNLIENRTDSEIEIDSQNKPCLHTISTPKIPSLSSSSDDHVYTLESSFDSFLKEKKVNEISISKSKYLKITLI